MSLTSLILAAMLLPVGAQSQTASVPWPAKGDLSLHISAVKKKVKSGLPVMIKVTLTNMSEHIIGLPWVRTDPPRNYKLTIRDNQGNPVQPVPGYWVDKQGRRHVRIYTGSIVVLRLSPGQSRVDEVDASKSYSLKNPGKYTAQVSWGNYKTRNWVKSNTITLTVTP